MKIRLSFLLSALLSTAALPGCFWEKSDPAPRAQISSGQVRLAEDLAFAKGAWPEPNWWERYNDPQLNALIEKALKSSPTMAAAEEAIAQAQAQVEMLRTGFSPQINAIAMVDRQRASATGFLGPYAKDYPKLGLTGPWYTAGTVGLTGSLTIDLWGKQRHSLAAVVGKRNANMAEAAAVELALATEVAQLYYSMQTGYEMLELLKQTHEVLEFVVQSSQGKAGTGLNATASVQSARAQLLAIQRQIVTARGQLMQAREGIRALIGAGADDMPEIKPAPLPAASRGVPVTLSYQFLARRPDLQALRWYVQASLSEIEVAKAAFYPSFDIKAFFGLDTIHLNNLFSSDSMQINLIPGLYLPIFNGGALRANLQGARAISNQLIERYNQAVLNAVRDVAMSGNLLQTLDEERQLQEEKVKAVSVALDSAEAHHKRGLAARTASMEARLPVITEQAALALLEGQLIEQEITLVKALGGGYNTYFKALMEPEMLAEDESSIDEDAALAER